MLDISNEAFSCRLCLGKQAELVHEFDKFPKSIWPKRVGSEEELIPLSGCVCQKCGHWQLSNYRDDYVASFYENNSFVLSESCPKGDRYELLSSYFNELKDQGRSVLDFGGGVNSILPFFAEDSEKTVMDFFISTEVRNDPGILKVEGDLNEIKLTEQSYDFIFLFHCLEHMNQPGRILSTLRESLKDDGLLFIEVPKADFYVENLPHYLYFHQHLNLFHENTLESMLKMNGYKVRKKFEVDGVLLFAVQKSEASSEYEGNCAETSKLVEAYNLKFRNLKAKVDGLMSGGAPGQRISLYGAGGSSKLFYYHFLRNYHIDSAFDIDPQKQGKYLYGGEILIMDPLEINIDEPDMLLFLNSSLHKQVGLKSGVTRAVLLTD